MATINVEPPEKLLGLSRRVSVIIPALDEAEALPAVLSSIRRDLFHEIIVVDNGSVDNTADVAVHYGAKLVLEVRRGYGAACLAGASAANNADILVFMDGDNSLFADEINILLAPLLAGSADIVIGSRTLGSCQSGALLRHARWGNALAAMLIRVLFKRRVTDLGPFRALTRSAWEKIRPTDPGFGFPVQTQVRALALGLRLEEVPVSYRRRIGKSKISGTWRGTILAGWAIIATIIGEFRRARHAV